MNDELHELENELRRLRPRAPSEFFEARVEAALESKKSAGFVWLRGLVAAGFAAAVAWATAFSPGMPDAPKRGLQPVAVHNEVQSARDEGLVTLDDGTTAQRLRIRYLETVRWSDGGYTLTWTAPCEQLRIVPVTAY